MNFNYYKNKSIELAEQGLYGFDLLMVNYIEENAEWISKKFDLDFSEQDLGNALEIANKWFFHYENITFDTIATMGLTCAKWKFINEEKQLELLNTLCVGNYYLSQCFDDYSSYYLDDFFIEKNAIINEEPVR